MTTLTIYNYGAETLEYVGSALALRDPLEEGEFILPANATTVAPPALRPLEAAVFDPNSGTWAIVPDRRGEVWYDASNGDPVTITALGDPSKRGFTDVQPPEQAPGQVVAFDNGVWEQVPDHRGETWFTAEGVPVRIAALGDPAELGMTQIRPDTRTDDEKLVSSRAAAQIQLIAILNAAVAPIENAYPDSERLSWTLKAQQATALMAKPADERSPADAPMLWTECTAQFGPLNEAPLLERMAELATRVLGKATGFVSMAAAIAGFRSKYQAAITAATSPAEVDALMQTAAEEITAAITGLAA